MKTGELKETVIKVHDIETNQSHNFNYKKECVKLNFTLRVDIPDELECFLAVLMLAQKDVEKHLVAIKPNAQRPNI